jgi:hypothetical protein
VKLLVAPHNDDEVLFSCFTLLREKPLVVVVFDGYVQANRGLPVTAQQRIEETRAACKILGVDVEFLGYRDDQPPAAETIAGHLSALAISSGITEIYAPAWEPNGHAQHNLVAVACDGLPVVERYLTYTPAGKSTNGRKVPFKGAWIPLKLRALACYESQMNLDPRMGCWPHFLRDQTEYYD